MSHSHFIYDDDRYLIIDPDTRLMSNDSGNRITIMQYDHNSERITFEIPRLVEGHDMSLSTKIRIHYVNTGTGTSASVRATNAGLYEVDDLEPVEGDSDTLVFSWLISQNATQLAGSIRIQVEFLCDEDESLDVSSYIWRTGIYSEIDVIASLATASDVVNQYPDALEQWKKEAFETTVGVGISSIEKTETSGLVDTYTITLSNGQTYTYTVTNGEKGEQGTGIALQGYYGSIEELEYYVPQGGSPGDAYICGENLVVWDDQTLAWTDLGPLAGESEDHEKRISHLEAAIADLNYEEILIRAFSASPSTAEMGSIVGRVTLSWLVNKTPISLTLDGSAIDTSLTSQVITDSITANTTWTLKATDERSAVSTKTASLSFINGVYYGAASEPTTLDSAFVLGLTKTLRSSKLSSFSANAESGQYIYYCLPTRMGLCSFKVGGFDGGFTLIATINFTNASGYTEAYYIYRSDNAGLGSTSVTVS